MNNTILEWEAGDLTDAQALHALASDYGEIESEIVTLEQSKKATRNAIEAITMKMGGKAVAAGFEMVITAATNRVSYDTKGCDALLAKLTRNGLFDVAEELSACRKESEVRGSLKIAKERAKK